MDSLCFHFYDSGDVLVFSCAAKSGLLRWLLSLCIFPTIAGVLFFMEKKGNPFDDRRYPRLNLVTLPQCWREICESPRLVPASGAVVAPGAGQGRPVDAGSSKGTIKGCYAAPNFR